VIDYGKRSIFGVNVDAIDLACAVERIAYFAEQQRSYSVSALAVHGLVEATRDPAFANELNNLDLVAPDGQPVRWALNALYGLDLPDKVPGPTIVERLLEMGADRNWTVYFYGSTPETLAKIEAEIARRFGGRLLVITTPSQFRPIDRNELDATIATINASGANLCLVGLGCPRQERFVSAAGARIEMPSLAIGAAFDYLAGNIERAPEAMQKAGLEWLYRTIQEPRRLARRYVMTNAVFSARLAAELVRRRSRRGGPTVAAATVPRPREVVDA
jgi:exopolysaccharide biosynthesis WecB/TagA/CpsF family protein